MGRCSGCKVEFSEIKKNGEEYKRCLRCRELARLCAKKNNCEHGKRRSRCKICDGSDLCKHGKRKSICKDCGGKHVCKHGKYIYYCKDCGGNGFCEHGKLKYFCKQCGGIGLCKHGKRQSKCKDCIGGSICEHKKLKYYCKECGGKGICKHIKNKYFCIICNPKKSCIECKSVLAQKYKPYCFRCFCYLNPYSDVATKYKLKENYIVDRITECFPDIIASCDQKISGGCSGKRPDWYVDCGTHNLIVEIDENQHADYSCENKRMMELFLDAGSLPLCIIRFNPDSYETEEGKVSSCFRYTKTGQLKVDPTFEERFEILKECIQKGIDTIPDKEIEEIKLFYTN